MRALARAGQEIVIENLPLCHSIAILERPTDNWFQGSRALTSLRKRRQPVAFLSGGVILNVLKEELPEERASRFWAFALGGVAYAVILLAL